MPLFDAHPWQSTPHILRAWLTTSFGNAVHRDSIQAFKDLPDGGKRLAAQHKSLNAGAHNRAGKGTGFWQERDYQLCHSSNIG
jgi:hypothetical protein